MLRRRSTKSRPDRDCRTSISSARSVRLEHLDPTSALRDAQKAASEAYVRGQQRLAVEMPHFPPLPLESSSSQHESLHLGSQFSRISSRNSPDRVGDGSGGAALELRRQQSVRFVAVRSSLEPSSDVSQSHHIVKPVGTGILHPRENLRRSTCTTPATSTTWQSARIVDDAASKMHTAAGLAEQDEYYIPEDDVASMPSSYRRLRRSQSMFSPRHCDGDPYKFALDSSCIQVCSPAPSRFATLNVKENKNPLSSTAVPVPIPVPAAAPVPAPIPALGPGSASASASAPTLRGPKSMSFLRARREGGRAMSITSRRSGNAAAIQAKVGAECPDEMSPWPPPSSFFRSKSRRKTSRTGQMGQAEQIEQAQRTLRRSLRSSVSETEGLSSCSPVGHGAFGLSVCNTKDSASGLKGKARKASRSITSKIRTLFGRRKKEADGSGDLSQPKQQKNPLKRRVSDSLFDSEQSLPADTSGISGVSGVMVPEEGSVSRVASRVASIHTVPPDQMLRSRQGSLESLRSGRLVTDNASGSRISSWESSDASTVASQQQAWSDWQRQRLSVIRENSAHGSLPSMLPPVHAAVDSQRVYSALMKKLNETQQLASIVEQQRRSSADSANPFGNPSPGSSSTSGDTGHDASGATAAGFWGHPGLTPRRTIRCVVDSSEGATVGRNGANTVVHHGSSSSRSDGGNNGDCDSCSVSVLGGGRCGKRTKAYGTGRLSPPAGLATPEHLVIDHAGENGEDGEDSPARGRPIPPHISSAFFGSPTSHLFRIASPYRRAIQENMRATDAARQQTYSESEYSSASASASAGDDNCAERIDLPDINTNSLGGPMACTEGASASQAKGNHRVTSSEGSVDWKTWLAANVSKLEPRLSPDNVREEEGLTSESAGRDHDGPIGALNAFGLGHGLGHRREAAQIYADEYEDACHHEIEDSPGIDDQAKVPRLRLVKPNVASATPFQGPVPQLSLRTSPDENSHLTEDMGPIVAPPGPPAAPPPPPPPAPPLPPLSRQPITARGTSCTSPSPSTPADKSRSRLQSSEEQKSTATRQTTTCVARARSINRIFTTEAGSPQHWGQASVKLIRRGNSVRAMNSSSAATAASGPLACIARPQEPQEAQEPQEPQESQARAGCYDGVCRDKCDGDGDGDVMPVSGHSFGGKRMVDLFLSSRRRRMTSSEGSSTGAFV